MTKQGLSEQINLMKDNQEEIKNAMEKVDNLKGDSYIC